MNLRTLVLAGLALSAPCSAQWSTASLSEGRNDLAATSVGSKALFAGGYGLPSGISDVVDLYDASTGAWSTANLSLPMRYMVAGSAGDVALFTGLNDCCSGNFFQPIVDVYEASTGTWSTTLMPNPHPPFLPAVTSVGDKIYFGGGHNPHNPGYTDRVDIYDTISGTWSLEHLSLQRSELAATTVGDLALFAGGNYTGQAVSLVDILDTQTSTWSTASLSLARVGLSATSVGGKALFAGGSPPNLGDTVDRVDIYDAATGMWSQAALSQPRDRMGVTSVGPYALFAGGSIRIGQNSAVSDRVDIYDSRTDTWSTATLSRECSRAAATTVDGLALFGGGFYYSDVVDVFDPELGTMYCVPAVPNSTGVPAVLRARGFLSTLANDLTLVAEQLPPGRFGYFITGLTQGFIQPLGSQGPICLSGNIGRYNRAGEIIQGPVASLQLDLTSMPVNPPTAAMPGDTWNFQCWYRDVNPVPTSNTTNGLAVTFATAGIPSVQFAVTQASLVEDTTSLEVRITLSQSADQDVSVSYATGGTATVNVDWRVEEPHPFVIPAGETRADMTLLVAEDTAQEPSELAIVSLAAPVGAVLGTATTFTLTIEDDD